MKRCVLCLLALAAGCNPVYAPPVRSTHYGTPGRLAAGDAQIMGEANQYGTGGVVLGGAVAEGLELEAGSDVGPDWIMMLGGVRLTRRWVDEDDRGGRPPPGGVEGPAVDVEAGLGGGIGGQCDNDRCAHPADDPLAVGAYLGLGAGYHLDWFSLFLRARMQVTHANDIPLTTWGTALGGVQFDIEQVVTLHLAGGYAGYGNDIDAESGLLGLLGVSVRWQAGL